MADETLLLIGTRKGLWLGRSDAVRQRVDHRGSALPDDGDLLLPGRHPRRATPAAGRGVARAGPGPQVFSSDDLGQTLAGAPDRLPRGHSTPRSSASGSWCPGPSARSCTPAPSRPRSSSPPTAARPSTSSGPCGTTPTAPSGAPASVARPSTPCSRTPRTATSVTVALSTGGVYQTHDGGELLGAAQPRDPGRVPARGPAVPRVRPVRAQGHPAPGQPADGCSRRTTAASTAPTTRARPGSRSPTGLPSDFGFPIVVHPHEPDTDLRLPDRRRRLAVPARGPAAGLALPRRRRDLGGARRGAARGVLRGRDARRDVHRHPRPRGPLLRRPQRQRLGLGRLRRDLARRSPPTCPT